MTDRIYLDHAATSPLRPEARAAMEEGFRLGPTRRAPHGEGRKAKKALEDARARIKRALDWDGEVIFTSGASESLWIALNKAKAKGGSSARWSMMRYFAPLPMPNISGDESDL